MTLGPNLLIVLKPLLVRSPFKEIEIDFRLAVSFNLFLPLLISPSPFSSRVSAFIQADGELRYLVDGVSVSPLAEVSDRVRLILAMKEISWHMGGEITCIVEVRTVYKLRTQLTNATSSLSENGNQKNVNSISNSRCNADI